MRTFKYTVKSPLTLDYEMHCTFFFSSSNMKRFDNERCEEEILPVEKKRMELLQIRLWENMYSVCMTFLAIYYAQCFYGFV